ncbi:BspA family leucine-rich repeat surface protein [Flagellimonas nanhaiensis]|nr:BspA family leucine-rich repeat surface protein [Allomuricauda nanhaiensis]
MKAKKLLYMVIFALAIVSCSKDDDSKPANQAPTVTPKTFTVSENSNSIGTVTASDEDGDDLAYTIKTNDNDRFAINAQSGQLTVAPGKSLDAGTYTIVVQVSDGTDTATATITIKVTEVDPVNQAPAMEDQEFSAEENIPADHIIGTVQASDPENDELTFAMVTDSDLFEITPNGEISLQEGAILDYETEEQYTIEISVSDGMDAVEAQVTIFVENVIEFLAEDPDAFIVTFKTDTDGEDITIGLHQGYTYDYTIDWGDGTVGNNASEHTYDNAGTYTVAIKGEFPVINMYQNPSATKLMSIEQWGAIQWATMYKAFSGCSNMVYNATDVPDLSQVTNMSGMFFGATAFNGDIGTWDVTKVVDMSFMFYDAESFNQDIGGWDVDKVTNMSSMFEYAESFNQDLNSWNVGEVTDMGFMFNQASAFNGDISNWNVINVNNMKGMFQGAASFNADISGWDVDNVTDVKGMFNYAPSFNRDLSNWNVGNVTDMSYMFREATDFDQNLGSWDISSVTTMQHMLDNTGLSSLNYDITLIGWESQNMVPNGIEFGALGLVYCNLEGMSARTSLIDVKGWNIIGDELCPEL